MSDHEFRNAKFMEGQAPEKRTVYQIEFEEEVARQATEGAACHCGSMDISKHINCTECNVCGTLEPVATVIWYDPKADMLMYERPHKIIDASIDFIENAPLGTKLYAQPAPQVDEAMVERAYNAAGDYLVMDERHKQMVRFILEAAIGGQSHD